MSGPGCGAPRDVFPGMHGEDDVFDDRWEVTRVAARRTWDDGLFTLRLDAARDFTPGQFTRVGLRLDDHDVHRAYSIASAPGRPLELFVVRVEGGRLTPSLDALAPGDALWVDRRCRGKFTAAALPDDARRLWLVGTGTGLAPYVAMLRDGAVLDRFDEVVVVHGARWARQLAYREELAAEDGWRYVAALTREDADGLPRGRLPDLLASGALEAAAGLRLDPDAGDHVLLCGNPSMIEAMKDRLAARGLPPHTRRAPGRVHTERYW